MNSGDVVGVAIIPELFPVLGFQGVFFPGANVEKVYNYYLKMFNLAKHKNFAVLVRFLVLCFNKVQNTVEIVFDNVEIRFAQNLVNPSAFASGTLQPVECLPIGDMVLDHVLGLVDPVLDVP